MAPERHPLAARRVQQQRQVVDELVFLGHHDEVAAARMVHERLPAYAARQQIACGQVFGPWQGAAVVLARLGVLRITMQQAQSHVLPCQLLAQTLEQGNAVAGEPPLDDADRVLHAAAVRARNAAIASL